jgi:3-hydroxyisobutyrate dehydrogenase-like beta-hydroxyacid dehydrogenase
MGLAMAQNIQRCLQQDTKSQLRFWNRTASRGTPLELLGAIGCESIAQLVAECDLIFISVSISMDILFYRDLYR